jgi:hypothetical protein
MPGVREVIENDRGFSTPMANPPPPTNPASYLAQTFVQPTPSSRWEFTHNLGRAPAGITLYKEDGETFDAEVTCTDTNITVTMFEPLAGKVVVI